MDTYRYFILPKNSDHLKNIGFALWFSKLSKDIKMDVKMVEAVNRDEIIKTVKELEENGWKLRNKAIIKDIQGNKAYFHEEGGATIVLDKPNVKTIEGFTLVPVGVS